MWPFKKKPATVQEDVQPGKPEKTYRELAARVDAAERKSAIKKINLAAWAFHLNYIGDRTDFLIATDHGAYSKHLEGIRNIRNHVFDEHNNCSLDPIFEQEVPADSHRCIYGKDDFRPHRGNYGTDDPGDEDNPGFTHPAGWFGSEAGSGLFDDSTDTFGGAFDHSGSDGYTDLLTGGYDPTGNSGVGTIHE